MCVFVLLRYENAKVFAKHPLREKKTILPKTCLLSAFRFLTYQKLKKAWITSYIGKQNNFIKIVCFQCVLASYL